MKCKWCGLSLELNSKIEVWVPVEKGGPLAAGGIQNPFVCVMRPGLPSNHVASNLTTHQPREADVRAALLALIADTE